MIFNAKNLKKCIQVLIGIWTQLFFEWHTVTFLGIRHNGSINFSRIYFGTHLRFASLEINDTQRTLHHSISPNLAPIQFTWRPLKQVTNSPLVHAPFVMLEMLARFLVSSDMSTSKELQAHQKKPVEKENAKELNLHNCKMNSFFHLIREITLDIFTLPFWPSVNIQKLRNSLFDNW